MLTSIANPEIRAQREGFPGGWESSGDDEMDRSV